MQSRTCIFYAGTKALFAGDSVSASFLFPKERVWNTRFDIVVNLRLVLCTLVFKALKLSSFFSEILNCDSIFLIVVLRLRFMCSVPKHSEVLWCFMVQKNTHTREPDEILPLPAVALQVWLPWSTNPQRSTSS